MKNDKAKAHNNFGVGNPRNNLVADRDARGHSNNLFFNHNFRVPFVGFNRNYNPLFIMDYGRV